MKLWSRCEETALEEQNRDEEHHTLLEQSEQDSPHTPTPGPSCCSEVLQCCSPRRRRQGRGPSPCVLSRLTLREPLGGPGALPEGASGDGDGSGSWVAWTVSLRPRRLCWAVPSPQQCPFTLRGSPHFHGDPRRHLCLLKWESEALQGAWRMEQWWRHEERRRAGS